MPNARPLRRRALPGLPFDARTSARDVGSGSPWTSTPCSEAGVPLPIPNLAIGRTERASSRSRSRPNGSARTAGRSRPADGSRSPCATEPAAPCALTLIDHLVVLRLTQALEVATTEGQALYSPGHDPPRRKLHQAGYVRPGPPRRAGGLRRPRHGARGGLRRCGADRPADLRRPRWPWSASSRPTASGSRRGSAFRLARPTSTASVCVYALSEPDLLDHPRPQRRSAHPRRTRW